MRIDEDDEPGAVADYLEANPHLALRQLQRLPDRDSNDLVERALSRAGDIADPFERMAHLRGVLDPLSERTRQQYAVRFPAYMDNPIHGVPFDACKTANRIKTVVFRMSAEIELAKWGPELDQQPDSSERYKTAKARIESATIEYEYYNGLLQPANPDEVAQGKKPIRRQLLYVNPIDKAGLIELHGNLAKASYAAALIPGATTDQVILPRITAEVGKYLKARPQGDVAWITFAPGDFPGHGGQARHKTLLEAASPEFALRIAPYAVLFSEVLAMETAAMVTMVGYSYGVVALGTALKLGTRCHQAAFVVGAGAGVGVSSVTDYAATDPDLKVLVLTPDSDYTRKAGLAALRLGILPTHLPGAIFLDPHVLYADDYPDQDLRGKPLTGVRGHIDIASPGTTAFPGLMAFVCEGDYDYLTSYPRDGISRAYDAQFQARRAVSGVAGLVGGVASRASPIQRTLADLGGRGVAGVKSLRPGPRAPGQTQS